MPGSDLGGAYVKISPDVATFREELQAEVDAATEDAKANLKVGADTADAEAKVDRLHAGIDDLKASADQASKLNLETDAAQERLNELLAELLYLRRDVETGEKLKIDTGDASAKLAEIEAQLAALRAETDAMGREHIGASGAGISGMADDAEALDWKLTALEKDAKTAADELDMLGRSGNGAGAGLDDAGRGAEDFSRSADKAKESGGGLLASLTALIPMAVPLGATLVSSMAALPAIVGGSALAFAGFGGAVAPVVGTLKAFVAANTNTGQSAQQAHAQLVTLQADMAQLSPTAREAVSVLGGQLYPAFKQFESADSSAFFGAAMRGLQALVPMFRNIEPYILQAAQGMGQTFSEMGKWSSSTQGLSQIDTILREGNGLFSTLGDAVERVIKGFAQLGSQGAPIVQQIGHSVDDVAAAFQRWTGDGGSTKFIAYVEANFPKVREFVDELAKTVEQLAKDWAGLGGNILSGVDILLRLADAAAKLSPTLAQVAIEGFGISKMVGAVMPAVEGLSKFMASDMVASLADSALSAAHAVTSFLGIGAAAEVAEGETVAAASGIDVALGSTGVGLVLVGLGLGIDQVVTHFKSFEHDVVIIAKGVAQDLKQFFDGAIDSIASAFASLYDDIVGVLNDIVRAYDNTIGKLHFSVFGHSFGAPHVGQIPTVSRQQNLLPQPGMASFSGLTWQSNNAGVPVPLQQAIPGNYATPGPLKVAPITAQGLPSTFASSVPGSATGLTPGTTSPAQSQAQTLTNSVNSLLSTLTTLAAPAKNAVVQQQVSLENAKRQMDTLTAEIVATHQAALQRLIPQMVDAYKAGMNQLAQLEATQRVTAQAARTSDAANARSTQMADLARLAADTATLRNPGGGTAADQAQVHIDKLQQSTDAVVAKAQQAVTAAANGTALQQAEAAKQLSDAQATQKVQLAAANATLTAAQTLQAAAQAHRAAIQQGETDRANGWQKVQSDLSTEHQNAVSAAATIKADLATAAADLKTSAATISGDVATAAADLTNAATQLANDTTKSAADALSGQATAIGDTSKVNQDQSNATVQAIQDQSKILTDTMAEQGKYGVALQLQQAQVALDQLKAQDDANIAQAQIHADQVKAADDAAVAAATAHLDQVTAQQNQAVALAKQTLDTVTINEAQKVAAAQANLDAVTANEARKVAAAQAHLDAVTTTQQEKVNTAQLGVDLATLSGNSREQVAAQQALVAAQNEQTRAVQSAQDAYQTAVNAQTSAVATASAQMTAAQAQQTAAVQQANNAYTQAQATSQQLVGAASSQLTLLQAQAAVNEANANAALTAQQDTAAINEATQQAIVDKLTETNTLLGQLGSAGIHIDITNQANPFEALDAMVFELRMAGLAA